MHITPHLQEATTKTQRLDTRLNKRLYHNVESLNRKAKTPLPSINLAEAWRWITVQKKTVDKSLSLLESYQ
ncbi:MAG: hypothetical protein CSYNP_01530 [Syntrophus sp. SKADARSKE-3]|nr:hypothetical protein [Syntrophus sp. SKADARSKE-3]